MKSLFIFFIVLCLSFTLCAQSIRLVNSTERAWSGGIAGHSGSNYIFVVEFSGYNDEPLPDTLWVGQEAFEIIVADSANQQNGNAKRTRTKKALRFEIAANTYHNEYADREPNLGGTKAPSHAPIAYKGVALLSYKSNGKERFYIIDRIMKEYPSANYP